MSETTDSDLECCGQRIDINGYCQYRPGHPRQITPELLDRAIVAAAREPDLEGQVQAVLSIALAE
jgi:hypothetical protein